MFLPKREMLLAEIVWMETEVKSFLFTRSHHFLTLAIFLFPVFYPFLKDIHLVLITVNFSFHHMLVLKNVYPPINYKPNLAVPYQINLCWNTSICLVSWVASSLLRRGMMGSNICYLTLQKKKYFKSLKKI